MMAVPPGLVKAQINAEKEINRILREASKEAADRARTLAAKGTFGNSVRAAQLSAVHSVIDEAFIAVGKEVAEQKAIVAKVAADLAESAAGDALRAAGYTDSQVAAYLRGSVVAAQTNVERAISRMNNYRYDYSDRVYKSDALAKGWLDNAVNKGIAQGQSADELAATVRQWVSPNTPGGANYAAKRLARTEIHTAFHTSSLSKYQGQPWVLGVKWNLSGSHSRTDECDDLAEDAHITGGDPGVFAVEDVPMLPHPNCLCFITPEVEDDATFAARLQAGDYDSYVNDNIIRGGGVPTVTSPTSALSNVSNIPTSSPKPTVQSGSAEDLQAQVDAIQAQRDPAIQQLLDDAYGRKALDPELKAQLEKQSSELYQQQKVLQEKIAALKPEPVILRASDEARATFDRLAQDVGDEAKGALQEWAGEGYKRINGAIPDGKTLSLRGVNPEYADSIRAIDEAMESIPNETLYRGMTTNLDTLQTGDVLTSNAFTATTTDIHTAAGFSQSAGSVAGTVQVGDSVTLLRISTGTRGRGIAVPSTAEYEIILARGSKMKVTGFSDEVIDGVNYHIIEVRL